MNVKAKSLLPDFRKIVISREFLNNWTKARNTRILKGYKSSETPDYRAFGHKKKRSRRTPF